MSSEAEVEESNKEALRYLSLGLVLMVLIHTLVHAAGNMRTTLYPLLKEEFSLTNQQIGLIASIPLLCQVLLSVPVGLFSDRFGAKKLIALSIILATAGAFLGGFSFNPWMYIVASTLLTLSSTIYHPPAQSYTSKITSISDRVRALGIWNAGGTFGVSLGPLSISVLMGLFAFQWRQVYQFWVIPTFLGLIAIYFVSDSSDTAQRHEEVYEEEEAPARTLLSRDMIMFLSSSGVRSFAGSLTTVFLSIWLVESQGWSPENLGIMLGAGSLMGIIAAPLGGEIASGFGEKRWMVLSLFASYTCFVIAIILKGFWPFFIFYLARRFFGMLSMPSNSSITARLSPPKQRGIGFGLSTLPGSIMGSIAPLIAAFIADTYGIYPIFIISSLISYMGLGILQFGVEIK
ncbi:MAG: MFS transporter [Candidatus Bathyarchaeia archaeon]